MRSKNTLATAMKVQRMVSEHYEPGRQDRCKLWVYRNIVYPEFPISDRTFFRYLKMEAGKKEVIKDKRQLDLFD
jgi:hypothetical protein